MEDYVELIYLLNNFENIVYNLPHVQWVDNTVHVSFSVDKNHVYYNDLHKFYQSTNDNYHNDHFNSNLVDFEFKVGSSVVHFEYGSFFDLPVKNSYVFVNDDYHL